jgi:hypothetical protein
MVRRNPARRFYDEFHRLRPNAPPDRQTGGRISTCTRRHPWTQRGTHKRDLSKAALLTCVAVSMPAQACWHEAASRYGLSVELLQAIARAESGLNSQAIGRNPDGSRDIGLMQINSAWLPTLAAHGISEQDLLHPCTSLQVGAWILAGNVQRLGYSWEAVGAYNARTPSKRQAYVRRIQRHLSKTTPAAQDPSFAASLRPLTP